MDFSIAELKNMPIVMTSMSRWDGDFSSASWSLAKTFSQTQPVIYVDYPYTILDFFRERKKPSLIKRKPALVWGKNPIRPLPEFGRFLFALTPLLMLPINWLPKGKLYDFFAKWNDRRLQKSIKKGLNLINAKEFIFFNSFNPLYMSQIDPFLEAKVYVYQSRDNIRALEFYLRKHGAENEIKAIRQADLSLATSKLLQKELMELSGKEVAYFPNAADFNLFKKAYEPDFPRPTGLEKIPGPIIGYTGNICHRINYDLLKSICEHHPDKSVVMIGPRNHWGHTEIDLDTIGNLYFLGPRKIEELPNFLAYFDLLILPFLCNEVTRSIYPLKINEYLASGKPIVATPFSEDMRSFDGLIRLEEDHLAFAQAINIEIKENNSQKAKKRYDAASNNTWEGRIQLFWKLLHQTLSV
ncbi:MAG: glycosyltransferase [Cyclobacteriaceae bacterium]